MTNLEIINDVCHRYRTVLCMGLGRILSNARFVDKNNNLAQKVSERQFDSLISSEKSFVGKKLLEDETHSHAMQTGVIYLKSYGEC